MKNCPNCNSSWIGDPIPQDIIEHYGDSTHWQRELHIDGGFLGIYDGTVVIKCPDCKVVMPRNNSNWAKEMFDKYIEATKCEIPEYAFKCDNCTCEDD